MVMKRIAVNIRPERVDGLISVLRKLGLEATIYDVKGAGKEKEGVHAGKLGTTQQAYTTRKLIATVVDGVNAPEILGAIKSELAGKPGRAIIIVSPVEDIMEV